MTAVPPAPASGRRVDLHSHTVFSDGVCTPEEVVGLAAARGLTALAITDHDSIEAFPRARAAVGGRLELIPALEMSSMLEGLDLHLLGYYVDPEDAALRDTLARFRHERLRRALAMVERLNELGAAVDPDEVLMLAGPGVVGRPHVAEALVRAGHVASLDDAFRFYIGLEGRAFVPRPAFRPEQAIAAIHAAGGVSVLAHPGPLPDLVIERLVEAGLRGLEVWHPQHNGATVRRYHALARRLRLLETGGSDFHTPARGPGLGSLPVPPRVLVPLKQAAGVAG